MAFGVIWDMIYQFMLCLPAVYAMFTYSIYYDVISSPGQYDLSPLTLYHTDELTYM